MQNYFYDSSSSIFFLYEYRKKHAIVGVNSKGRREKRVLQTRYYVTLLGKKHTVT
jgi:hypothetical protein